MKKLISKKRKKLTENQRAFIIEYRKNGCNIEETAKALKTTARQCEAFLKSDLVKEQLLKGSAETAERIKAMTPWILDCAVHLLKTTKSDKVRMHIIDSLLDRGGVIA